MDASRIRDEPHGITDANRPAAHNRGIERQFVVESPDNVAQYAGIHLQRVGVDRRHVTASAQGIESNDDLADVKLRTWPVALVEPIDAADHDVGSKPADIPTEGCDGAIGRDEQWKNVETIEAVIGFEPRVGAGGRFHQRERIRTVPGMTVDKGLAARTERATQSEQPVLTTGGSNAFGSSDADRPIAHNAVRFNDGRRQTFSGQRFHRVSP